MKLFLMPVLTPVLLMCMLLISELANAQPKLTRNAAFRIIDHALQHQSLFWQGFAIPYAIERNSKDKDAAMLDALYRNKMLTRKDDILVDENHSSGRRKVLLVYLYEFTDPENEYQGGFYYGRGRLKEIIELSPPYLIGEYYYAEAYIAWSVVDFQSWAADPAFRKARTLRRSKESGRKPFEKRVYLQYDGSQWGFWQGEPGAL